jgi:hypothetical protein
MEILRKYGAATTVLFPLIDAGAQDFESTPVSHASGDTQISKDEAAFANTTNAFAHEGNGIYSLALTATEMEAARVVVTIIDQGSKAWEDQALVITTYGGSSAQHPVDLIADHVIRRTFQNACDSSDGDAKSGRSLLGAIAKLVNKVTSSGGTLTVYEDDDSTSLYTQTVTTSGAAEPITALDTD